MNKNDILDLLDNHCSLHPCNYGVNEVKRMKSILDKCRQIKDPESGRVLIYRDEIEAVLEAERLLHGDTIYRRAAIDALMHEWDGMVVSVFDVINQLPSAQPEVIRCKDCKHRHYLDNEPYCSATITFGWAEDDFCSYAERREDGTHSTNTNQSTGRLA